jgi:hypothetical protein
MAEMSVEYYPPLSDGCKHPSATMPQLIEFRPPATIRNHRATAMKPRCNHPQPFHALPAATIATGAYLGAGMVAKVFRKNTPTVRP